MDMSQQHPPQPSRLVMYARVSSPHPAPDTVAKQLAAVRASIGRLKCPDDPASNGHEDNDR